MKNILLLCFSALFFGATTPKNNETKAALGTFAGDNATLCYTSQHLAMIMTYFIDEGTPFYNVSLNQNETEGFYLEGTAKKNDKYQLTRVTLQQEDNKLYISTQSKIYFCVSKIEGDCILTVRKFEGGRRTFYEPRSKSGKKGEVSPGIYGRDKDKLPATLLNYLAGLNIGECN